MKPEKSLNAMYWQVIVRRESDKLGGNLEDIINFAEVQRTQSICHFLH